MKETYWGVGFVIAGVIGIALVVLLIRLTTNDQNDYYALKEVTEASMMDAIDIDYYRYHGEFRIVRDRFVESFIRRWSAAATNGNDAIIEINDVIEMPPKVSVTVKTGNSMVSYDWSSKAPEGATPEEIASYKANDVVTNRINAILEEVK